ncbi:MAG: hypothetical protein SO360_01725 [Bifidobacterium tsurumiense]|uniref:hypothetical protein n=1 Tax=Bifidobacterium tsurumiense TaxID=356829 RepID=UPI002A804869|nr:hypothetical protein [Bifidobacterium tsurumiense]MDY4677571.1 hypothetical protein [Bifidobacterium tsurumiense]
MAKRHRRLRIIPSHLPLIRDRLAQFQKTKTGNMLRRWNEDAEYRGIADSSMPEGSSFVEDMHAAWNEADRFAAVQLWWVSDDMTRLASDTAQSGDFPLEGAPASMGMMFLERGLDVERAENDIIHIVGLQWEAMGKGILQVSPLLDDPDFLQSTGASAAGLPVDFGWLSGEDGTVDKRVGDFLTAFLNAAWTLSMQPRITTVKPAEPSTEHPLPSKFDQRIREVKILVLRENLHSPGMKGDDEKVRREYSHRFIVRGFWRMQTYGPRNSLRRRQWVPPFVKGPADKPLLAKETVRLWRR